MLVPNRHGSSNSYRNGFQGQEKDDELKGEGNHYDYGFRVSDPRIGKFFSVDPLTKQYPMLTPYQFASNSPISGVDLDGLEYYYSADGKFLGNRTEDTQGKALPENIANDVRITSSVEIKSDLILYHNPVSLNMQHNEFVNNSYLIFHEASIAGDSNTALWIAHSVNNALNSDDRQLNRGEETFNQLFKTGYSSIGAADKGKTLSDSNSSNIANGSRAAMISVLSGKDDPTGGAMLWDGMDLVSDYDGKESILQHPKFRQYQSVYISTPILESSISFWSDKSNARKVNSNRTILTIEKTNGVVKNDFGKYYFDENFFIGATKAGKDTRYDLKATGFQSGTIFYKPELPKNETK